MVPSITFPTRISDLHRGLLHQVERSCYKYYSEIHEQSIESSTLSVQSKYPQTNEINEVRRMEEGVSGFYHF